MDKNDTLLKLYGIFGMLGFFTQIFMGMETSYIILLVLIILDTFTGVAASIKYKRFSSTGLRKCIRKIITYAVSVITVRLLELILNPIVTTTMLSKIIIIFLAITESVSILGNLTLLGVPFPTNFLPLLIKTLKIPLLKNMLEESRDKEKELSDIQYIINSQITNLEDIYMKIFLKIRYDACKSIIDQIMLIDETNDNINNSDILYCKVITFVELALKKSNKLYAEDTIPTNYIESFSKNDNNTIFELLANLKIICYSNKNIKEKKDQIIDVIIILLYQTIIDSQKSIKA
ncbi:MAG TPA: phage holin family protein [Clostridium sp.]|uniref:phage holin family protein n=1 Tax=Clostridium sp. TaxID=1506 RepID=UPI002F922901